MLERLNTGKNTGNMTKVETNIIGAIISATINGTAGEVTTIGTIIKVMVIENNNLK